MYVNVCECMQMYANVCDCMRMYVNVCECIQRADRRARLRPRAAYGSCHTCGRIVRLMMSDFFVQLRYAASVQNVRE